MLARTLSLFRNYLIPKRYMVSTSATDGRRGLEVHMRTTNKKNTSFEAVVEGSMVVRHLAVQYRFTVKPSLGLWVRIRFFFVVILGHLLLFAACVVVVWSHTQHNKMSKMEKLAQSLMRDLISATGEGWRQPRIRITLHVLIHEEQAKAGRSLICLFFELVSL